MLAAPRPPLLLVGISQSVLPALDDLVQGFVSLGVVGYLGGFNRAIHCWVLVAISTVACIAVFILAGSVAFFCYPWEPARKFAPGDLPFLVVLSNRKNI